MYMVAMLDEQRSRRLNSGPRDAWAEVLYAATWIMLGLTAFCVALTATA